MNYNLYLESKSQFFESFGFDPIWMPNWLFDFQKKLVLWALKKGRCAIFADCGLGKTAMQLVWAQNIVEKTNKNILILTPISVGLQTIRESEKLSITSLVLS